MAELASAKVGFRTALGFVNRERPAATVPAGIPFEDRHLLAYPVTHHAVAGWSESSNGRLRYDRHGWVRQSNRLANQIRFKVLKDRQNSRDVYHALIFHLPCALPHVLSSKLSTPPSLKQQITTWQRVLLGVASALVGIGSGHLTLHGRRYRMMGNGASASVGAVVAHHQAPLGQVLRRLRDAESRAKREGGRDAFAISLLKRSGGAVYLTCPWLTRKPGGEADWRDAMRHGLEETPMGQLVRLRNWFGREGLSRRAAFITQGWLAATPDAAMGDMLGLQFQRQLEGGFEADKKVAGSIGRAIAAMAQTVSAPEGTRPFIDSFLAVAEFLAREGRVTVPRARAS